MADNLTWTMSPGGIRVPPLPPLPSDIHKPDDAFCDICQGVGFEPSKFFVDEKSQVIRGSPSDGHSQEDNDDADSTALSDDSGTNFTKQGESETDDEQSEVASDSFGQDSIDLGNIVDVRSRTHCPFCRLALAAVGGPRVPNEKNGEPVSLEVSVMTNGFGDISNARPTRVLMPSVSAGSEWVEEAAVFPEITLMANDRPEATTNLVRTICREKIDFRMVSNWLAICEALHGDECRKRPGMDDLPVHPATILNEFRLIDVKLGCIVAGTSDCKYAALSYVWGQANVLRAGKCERMPKAMATPFRRPKPRRVVPVVICRDSSFPYLLPRELVPNVESYRHQQHRTSRKTRRIQRTRL